MQAKTIATAILKLNIVSVRPPQLAASVILKQTCDVAYWPKADMSASAIGDRPHGDAASVRCDQQPPRITPGHHGHPREPAIMTNKSATKISAEQTEFSPKFVVNRNGIFENVQRWKQGTALASRPFTPRLDRWPAGQFLDALIPVNDDATAMLAYIANLHNDPRFPKAPWNDAIGVAELPDLDNPRPAATTETPMWRTTAEIGFLNGCPYKRGSVVKYLGWPKFPAHNIEPVNEPAKLIARYFARYSTSPYIPTMPLVDGRVRLPYPAPYLPPSFAERDAAEHVATMRHAKIGKRIPGADSGHTAFEWSR
jgi:hypothetical protein